MSKIASGARGFGLVPAALLAACASTPPPATPAGETRAFATEDEPGARTPRPDPRIPARHLDGPPALVELCDLLRDGGAMAFKGNEVARARAREQHDSRKVEAMNGRYLVDIRSTAFAFRDYDLNERVLVVPGDRFAVGDGAELYATDGGDDLVFALGPQAAERVLKLHNEGTLLLRLVFRPATSEMRDDACMRLGGGIAKLGMTVLAGYLVGTQGNPLARFETQEFQQVMGAATPVATPTITLADLMSADGQPVGSSLGSAAESLRTPLLACYRKVLATRPNVRGKLVVQAELGKDGRLRAPRMEVSSLGDDELVACALDSVTKAVLGAPPRSQLVFVPITFGSAEAAAP